MSTPAGAKPQTISGEAGLDPLRLSEERLRLAIAGAAMGTWHWEIRTGQLTWSEQAFAMFGLTPQPEMNYERFIAAIDPRDREHVQEVVQRAMRDRTDLDLEFRVRWPDGSQHWLATRGRAFYDAEGAPISMEGVSLDVTARKQSERALRESEERFRLLADAIPHMVWQLGADGQLLYANRPWHEYYRRKSLSPSEWTEIIHPDDLPRAHAAWSEFTRNDPKFAAFRLRRHDGHYTWFDCRALPVTDADGKLLHVVGTATDIEHLKQTETALRESRARLDTALHAAGMGTWVWHMNTDKVQLDTSLAQLLGYTEDEAANLSMEMTLERVHADDLPVLRSALARSRDFGVELDAECRVHARAGLLWAAWKGRAEAGTNTMFGACVDVTRHKRLEDELRQTQKMEAIGQLAGGVAHDFNNLLMVILGQASLITYEANVPEAVKAPMQEIVAASERAASLTAQLLAFGRRQTLQLKDIDLNELVLSVGQMLKRLLGESVALELETEAYAPTLRADPNMLVQVLLNLALNARDAMPAGGRLTLRTSREAPAAQDGRGNSWACLTVSDTGEGIPTDILPHIFEPFFTTKEVGKGSGLGLAMVYGIVKQHYGFVSVDSAPGRGTTFKVLLPLATHTHSEAVTSPPAHPLNGERELVLLVEDDPAVRATISIILEKYNYRLLVADDGVQALELFASRAAEIDLLLSDVVLPRGLSGAELAQQLRSREPRLPVILCSGYSADKLGSFDGLQGMAYLQKPYRSEELLTLMRNLLTKRDRPPLTAAART